MMVDSLTYCAGFALMGLAVNAEMLYAAKFILGKLMLGFQKSHYGSNTKTIY